jgi:hypothetical protein
MKTLIEIIIILVVVIIVLASVKLAYGAGPAVVLPSPDYLTKEQYSFYNKTLDCNSPAAIAPYIWNYSDFISPKEQCELYKQAATFMQPKTYEFKIPLPKIELNMTVTNVTVIKP